jgi:putative transposase
VWSTDATYIRLALGFAYLVAIIDWYSRRAVLAHQQQNERVVWSGLPRRCLARARQAGGVQQRQGSQFTSAAFSSVLKREGVAISMAELMVGLAQYFTFYNVGRPHQSLGYRASDEVYRNGEGGDALIFDRYGANSAGDETKPCWEQLLEDEAFQRPWEGNMGQRRATAEVEADTA